MSERSPYSLGQMRENHKCLVEKYPPHIRPVGVYEPPSNPFRAVDWDEVEKTTFDTNADFRSISLFWTAARGSRFVDATSVPAPIYVRDEVMFELVPEWSNPHDSSAVAIQLHGVRVGYVAASMSWRVHEYVYELNGLGLQVLLPGDYHADYDSETRTLVPQSWIVMPTWRHWESIIERAKQSHPLSDHSSAQMPRWESELMKVWEAVDETVRESIADNAYHLTLEQSREIIKHRDRAPGSRLPEQLDKFDQLPATLDWFLRRRRLEQRAQEAEDRRELLEESVRLWRSGRTQNEAAMELGLSPSAVGKAVRSSVHANVDVATLEEIGVLRGQGWSKGAIARKFMLSASAVTRAVKQVDK